MRDLPTNNIQQCSSRSSSLEFIQIFQPQAKKVKLQVFDMDGLVFVHPYTVSSKSRECSTSVGGEFRVRHLLKLQVCYVTARHTQMCWDHMVSQKHGPLPKLLLHL